MPSENPRNEYVVTHSRGVTIVPVIDRETGAVPTLPVKRNGQEELYVTEVAPADIIYIKGEGLPEKTVSFSDVASIMKRKIKGYAEDRSAYFVQMGFVDDRSVYETTRLRYDLFHAVAEKRPDLFEPDELQNIDDRIFRRVNPELRQDFSKGTAKRVANYVVETAKDVGAWRYRNNVAADWLNGDVIHPIHNKTYEEIKGVPAHELAEDIFWVAYELGSESLMDRASAVVDTLKAYADDPKAKDDDPYFRLTDSHRIITKLVRGIKSKHGGQKRERSPAPNKGVVYDTMHDWVDSVREEIDRLVESDIVPAEVYKVEIRERPRPDPGKIPDKHSKGMPRRVVFSGEPGSERKNVYVSLGSTVIPDERPAALKKQIESSMRVLGGIYKSAVDVFVQDLDQRDIAGLVSVTLLPDVPGSMKPFASRGGNKPIINLDWLRFLSPLEEYSVDKMLKHWTEWNKLEKRALNDRRFRRELMREMRRKGLPENYPAYADIHKLYRQSPLLPELFEENYFTRAFFSGTTETDVEELDLLASDFASATTPGIKAQAMRLLDVPLTGPFVQLFTDLKRATAEGARALIEEDKKIPADINVFRWHMFAALRNLKGAFNPERALLGRVLNAYGLKNSDVLGPYREIVEQTADYTRNRIIKLKEQKIGVGPLKMAMIGPGREQYTMINI